MKAILLRRPGDATVLAAKRKAGYRLLRLWHASLCELDRSRPIEGKLVVVVATSGQ